ncbi:hypothetical protein ABIB95_005644 [Bradyrhizobium sp. LA2.1]
MESPLTTCPNPSKLPENALLLFPTGANPAPEFQFLVADASISDPKA